MPAKDVIHDAVCNALKKDGWIVTHEHMRVDFEDTHVYVDIGAERLLVAERADEKIAIEVKSFIGRSTIQDMENAVGQFMVYRVLLQQTEPTRHLFIGISHITFETVFQSKAIQKLVNELSLSLLIVNIETEEVELWIRK